MAPEAEGSKDRNRPPAGFDPDADHRLGPHGLGWVRRVHAGSVLLPFYEKALMREEVDVPHGRGLIVFVKEKPAPVVVISGGPPAFGPAGKVEHETTVSYRVLEDGSLRLLEAGEDVPHLEISAESIVARFFTKAAGQGLHVELGRDEGTVRVFDGLGNEVPLPRLLQAEHDLLVEETLARYRHNRRTIPAWARDWKPGGLDNN